MQSHGNSKIIDKAFFVNYLFTCSQAMISSVMISNSGIPFLSLRLNISRTMESRFHIPSGSRPLNGRRRDVHSAAAGGALVLK